MSTPFQNAGYTKDTRFKVLNDYGIFKVGDIAVLGEDDGTCCPPMVLLGTEFDQNDDETFSYMFLPSEAQEIVVPELEVIAEPCPSVSATDSEGWILNIGAEPQYLIGGGEIDVKFRDGKISKNVANSNRRGDGSTRGAYTWHIYESGCCVRSWKPSVTSSVDDTAILEPKVYTDHQEGEVSPKASTGASVDITINITIDGNSWGITRDEAFKLFKDLKHIFEEKVI